jgi:hypothetical protein
VHSPLSGVIFCLDFDLFFLPSLVPLWSVFSLFIYLNYARLAHGKNLPLVEQVFYLLLLHLTTTRWLQEGSKHPSLTPIHCHVGWWPYSKI